MCAGSQPVTDTNNQRQGAVESFENIFLEFSFQWYKKAKMFEGATFCNFCEKMAKSKNNFNRERVCDPPTLTHTL